MVEDDLGFALVVAHGLRLSGQAVHAVGDVVADALAVERRRVGDEVRAPEDAVVDPFEVVRRDHARRVERKPDNQAPDDLAVGAVEVVDEAHVHAA